MQSAAKIEMKTDNLRHNKGSNNFIKAGHTIINHKQFSHEHKSKRSGLLR